MSSIHVNDSNLTQNPAHSSSIVLSFQLVFTIIMTLKRVFLREIFLLLLGNDEDKLSLITAFNLSIKFSILINILNILGNNRLTFMIIAIRIT